MHSGANKTRPKNPASDDRLFLRGESLGDLRLFQQTAHFISRRTGLVSIRLGQPLWVSAEKTFREGDSSPQHEPREIQRLRGGSICDWLLRGNGKVERDPRPFSRATGLYCGIYVHLKPLAALASSRGARRSTLNTPEAVAFTQEPPRLRARSSAQLP